MDETTKSILLYSTSTAAQVWSALLVFWVLLIRDKNLRKSQQIQEIWNDAKYWWTGLIQNLRDKNGLALGNRLDEIGLDEKIVFRAETDVEAFKKILKITKEKELIKQNNLSSETPSRTRIISGDTFQSTMDALAERLDDVENENSNPKIAFTAGLLAIGLNVVFLFSINFSLCGSFLLYLVGGTNFLVFAFFICQAWPALTK